MTYKINGTSIPLQPTEAGWRNPSPLGIGADGIPRYPLVKSFEMSWDLLSASELNTLQGFFTSQSVTGTSVVDLPKYAHSSYEFFAYSGCTLYLPDVGEFFEEYTTSVSLVVDGIRT